MTFLTFRRLIRIDASCFKTSFLRNFSSFNVNVDYKPSELPTNMSGWEICGYNGLQSLKLTTRLDVPPITRPNEVLVETKAASVNPLDAMMTDGYGQQLFEKFSEYKLGSTSVFNTSTHKPFIPGRDFAGVVRAVGEGVKHLQPGDEVMGVIPPPLPGSHAQYVVAPTCNILKKPNNLTMEEAASIPYAGLTAWSALGLTGELCINSRDKRVLVLGATGGVGMIAIQLSKIWGAMVVSTGSSEALNQLLELGSDFAVDYTSPEAQSDLLQFGGFDVILDCTGQTGDFSHSLLKPWSNAKYVTLSPPTLRNFDEHGLIGGIIKNGIDLLTANSSVILEGKTTRWAYFVPSSSAFRKLVDLARDKKLRTVIDSVFPFDQLPEAYAKMKDGHKQGKIIVQM